MILVNRLLKVAKLMQHMVHNCTLITVHCDTKCMQMILRYPIPSDETVQTTKLQSKCLIMKRSVVSIRNN